MKPKDTVDKLLSEDHPLDEPGAVGRFLKPRSARPAPPAPKRYPKMVVVMLHDLESVHEELIADISRMEDEHPLLVRVDRITDIGRDGDVEAAALAKMLTAEGFTHIYTG